MKISISKKIVFILLAMIILFGFLFRVSFLEKQDYWYDEGSTIMALKENSLAEVTSSLLIYETSTPIYFYILYSWIRLFGDSPFSTRFLSVIFGTFSILLIFLITKKISNKKIALLTSFLFSISMINIWYSQETRPYSLFIFLSLLSTLFFVRILKDNKGKNNNFFNYLFYFFSLILCLYTSYFAVFFIFLHFSYLLFTKKYKILKKTFFIQVFSFLLVVPWFIMAYSNYPTRQNIVSEILLHHAGLPKIIAQFGQFALISPLILFSLLILVICLINLKYSFNKMKINYNILALLISLSFIFYLILLLNIQIPIIRKSFTWVRYAIFLIPAGHFIIAKTLNEIGKKARVILIVIILLISFFALYTYYSSTLKEEWAASVTFIHQTRDSSDGIIFIDEGGGNTFLIDYYYKGDMQIVELAWKDKQLSIDKVKELAKDKKFVWLILSRNWKRKDLYKNLFDETFNFQKSKEFYGIKLYLYDN